MKKFIGYGLGLRTVHYQHVLEHKPDVDWFEVHSENFMVAGGKPKYNLHAIREHYPLVLHGVSMSIGSTDPLDFYYLKKLKTLVAEVQPEWISDHFCWTSVGDINSHDLLPMPYNEEAIQHLVDRITQVQDFMGRQVLFENVSSYLTYKNSEIEEWEFISEIVKRSDCKILLDINNIYVSSRNHGFSPHEFMNHIDPKCVQQFHLAGHEDCGDYVIDTHDHDVPDPVWELYADALKRFGPISTMIERDDNIPEFSELHAEMNHAKEIAKTVHPQAA